MKGTVKFYNEDKHFGFINGDDGKDYFFHSSDLAGGHVRDNDAVEFEGTEGDRGPRAKSVKAAGATSTPEPESSAETQDEAS